jgi:3-oxoadipate enol-lactonase
MPTPVSFPPLLPPGRTVTLPGRGQCFIREAAGPEGAPTVLLLHGWLATADLNWWSSYNELARAFHVVAMDERGHGRGVRSRGSFRLTDCADDAAALITKLQCGPAIVVGYSMGGPVAQLTWQRHPDAVRGLVLCATSAVFPTGPRYRAAYAAMGYAIAASPPALRRRMLGALLTRNGRRPDYREWLMEEVRGHDMGSLLEAGRELGRFDSRPWLGGVDVPTSCIVMSRDDVVSPERQRALAASIPAASVREIDADHIACARAPQLFVPALVAACREVETRGGAERQCGSAASA